MLSALLEKYPYHYLSPGWIKRILHIVAVIPNTPITVEDIHLAEKVLLYAKKSSFSIEDCWLILENVLKDDRILGRLLRTATFITLLSIADGESSSQLDWRRVVDDAFSPALCSSNFELKECYRQRLIVICPMYIYCLWNDVCWDMDTVQKVYQLMDVLEREDFRLILQQLLVRVSKTNGNFKTQFLIEPMDWVLKTKSWLGNILQLQINQFSEAKRFSYRAIIALWKLAILSPQHTLYQICNSAVSREGDLTKYVSLVKELYPVASFESESNVPCLLIQWLQQSLQVVVKEECWTVHSWISSQVSAVALREWTGQLLQGSSPLLLNPLHYIYYVLVPLPVTEKWIPHRTWDKLNMIASLLEVVEKVLLPYYRNYNQMVEWGLHDERIYFRFSIEDSVFDWLRNIHEKRWLLPFSLRRKFVDFIYTFLLLPRKEEEYLYQNQYWNRWITRTDGYSTRVLLYCLYCRTCSTKLRIPFTFDNNYGWNTLTYLYLREIITIGEVSVEFGREALLCLYESATKSQSTIEKELVQVEVPYAIAQSICDWESSEQWWHLVLLQKWVYLSYAELERLACGLLTCAVECKIWKDSMKPWVQHIYEENPLLLSSREEVHSFITIGKVFLRLLLYYYRVDQSVLLITSNDNNDNNKNCDEIERKYAIQLVCSLIQIFQGKTNTESISKICYAFEILVEATEMYSILLDERILERDQDTLELWDMLLLGLSTELLHNEMGKSVFMVPFLKYTPHLKNNKLKEQLQNQFS
ncbi:hypothetical protein GpartN1_g1146.t1 [Galdieria partita]|uniref:Uncharacterized protein n=1 Tax=Galdieria partita TaxID=83374 RepID=A0A9C7UNC3_9RHOD|nr:hypothetical protein GpartN1_g1146.t1 [Galdieria partita]